MLQNPCKTLGFKKNMVYEIAPGEGKPYPASGLSDEFKFALFHQVLTWDGWERSGSVVECLTRDRRVAGSSLTGVTALWYLSKTHLS